MKAKVCPSDDAPHMELQRTISLPDGMPVDFWDEEDDLPTTAAAKVMPLSSIMHGRIPLARTYAHNSSSRTTSIKAKF